MNKETYEALKRIMYMTIWVDTNAKKADVFKVITWIDEVAKEYEELGNNGEPISDKDVIRDDSGDEIEQ